MNIIITIFNYYCQNSRSNIHLLITKTSLDIIGYQFSQKRKFYQQGYIEFQKTGNVVTVFLGALTLPHTIIDCSLQTFQIVEIHQ